MEDVFASQWVQPSDGSTWVFLGIVSFVMLGVIGAYWRAVSRLNISPAQQRQYVLWFVVGAFSWLVTTGALAHLGVTSFQGPPPGLPLVFIAILAGAFGLAFSHAGTILITKTPVALLILFHGFRLPLELVLLRWFQEGVIPVQLTASGHNFDIVSGILGLLLGGIALWRPLPRGLILLFNMIGTALLAVIGVIVILSSPLPIKQYPGQPVLLGMYVPYIWIATVCVAGALFGHLLIFRWLARNR